MVFDKSILLILVLLLATITVEARHKFPGQMKKEVCSYGHEDERNNVLLESMCGEPKDVFIELNPRGSHIQVSPSAAWVKRCVGLCFDSGSECVATKKRYREIPVRLLDVKTNKESCARFTVEEHEECGCGCPLASEECSSPRKLNQQAPEYEVESI